MSDPSHHRLPARGRLGFADDLRPVVVCCLVLAALAVRQEPGRIVADTKLDLTADPAGFLSRALHLWDPSAAFGQLQNQAYGYLFPMGPFFLLGDVVGMPAWLVQRVWWALVMIVAFVGVVRLAGVLGIGAPWSRLLGGLAYALAPRVLGSLGAISIEAWPTALAPWVLIPVVRASMGRSPRRCAAASALAVLCVGGVNAAATAAALVPAGLWVLLAPRWPGRLRFVAWWVGCVGAVTVWWWGPLVLLGGYSPPFLDWIETAANTTEHTSLVEVIRGTDHWLAYLRAGGGPVWPAGWLLVSHPLLIIDTALVAAAGLAGLVRTDMPARRVLLGSLVVGATLIAAGYAGAAGGALAEPVRQLLDGPLAALRNVHKFDLVVRLPLVLGLAHLLASLGAGVLAGRHVRRLPMRYVRALAVGLTVVVFAGVATPALAGKVAPRGSYEAIPDYWHETAAWLDANVGDGRALLVPGSPFADYTWGAPRDEPVQALTDIRWAIRDSVPLSSAGNIRLLDAIERRLAAGVGGAGVVEALHRMQVTHLVVRNDLDLARTGAPRPVLVRRALADLPGVRRVAVFGPQRGAGDQPDRSVDSRLDVRRPAVEVYQVGESVAEEPRVWTWPLSGTVRLSGGPESLLAAGDAGLLDGRAVFVGPDGATVKDPAPVPVVTDGARRRAVWFGATRDNATEVLAAGDDGPLGRAARDFQLDDFPPGQAVATVPANDPARETVAIAGGVVATASSAGSDPRATMARGAEHSPWAALDGDVETSWISGEYGRAEGQWWQVEFPEPREIGSVELVMLAESPVSTPARRVSVTTEAGAVEAAVGESGAVTVPLPAGPTRWVRVTVLDVAPGVPSGVGIREVRIPGPQVTRALRVPAQPVADLGGVESSAQAVVLAVADGRRGECVTTGPDGRIARCAAHLRRTGEENSDLRRRIDLAVGGPYRATVTGRPRPGPALETLLAPAPGAMTAEASSRAVVDPLGRPDATVDRDSGTGWIAAADDEAPTLTLRWGPERVVEGLRIVVEPWLAASRPARVQVTAGDTSVELEVGQDGTVRLPAPVRTRELTVAVTAVHEVVDTDLAFGLHSVLPVGVSELIVQGADDLRQPVDEDAEVALGCGAGPALSIDGALVPTAVTTTVGDLLWGRRLEARPCAARPVTLRSGISDLAVAATPTVRPETSRLLPAGPPDEPPDAASGVEVTVRGWEPTRRAVEVSARDEPVVLAVPENANAGWQASLDGQALQSVRLDGWSQGYVLPPGEAGVVELVYIPDRPYRMALGAGVAGVVAVVLVGWSTVRRTARWKVRWPVRWPVRWSPERCEPLGPDEPAPVRSVHRRPGSGVVAVLAAAALPLLGGAAGLVALGWGVAAAVAGRRWAAVARSVPAVSGLAVVLAGLVVAANPWPQSDPGAHSAVAQVLVLAGLATATIGASGSASGVLRAGRRVRRAAAGRRR